MNNKGKRKYNKSFKDGAIKLIIEEGYTVTEAARNLGINAQMLSKWKCKSEKEQSRPQSDRDLEAENKRLRQENKRLLMEREILKKAAAFFAKESE